MNDMTTSFPIIANRYQISGTLASGGMAIIYKAQDLTLERPVALKILKKELSNDLSFQNRFRQEARASARLIHPNIVTTFDFGYDQDRLFIALEYIDGVELSELMSGERTLPVAQALDFLTQACEGLAYAHQQGFVHCDIKPQNLLITNQNVLKITDFGISRALETISREEQHDVVWGSPYYISPEQSAGKAPSPATDIYSLGVIAYELLAGRLPFLADEAAELARMHRMVLPKPLKEISPEISEELSQVVMRCLKKDPEDRFESASLLKNALERAASHHGITASQNQKESAEPSSIPPRSIDEKGKPDISTVLLALLTLILAGGLIPFWLYVVLSMNSINR